MNPEFANFLKHCAADKNEKKQIPRLKVLERRALLGNYNNSIRSGSSLSTSTCENERKIRAIEALNNIFDTFNSAASSTFT